jgi:hypothetical protein
MKIKFKRSMSVLAVSCLLFFQGCGGGGSGGDDSGNNGGGKVEYPAGKTFKFNRVSIAGSSITWGEGYLGEKSYVGEVEKYFREEVADTINPTELKALGSYSLSINEPFSYQGELITYTAGSSISGTLEASDEIIIVYGGSSATVEMEVDGQICGTKTISGNFKPVKVISPANEKDLQTGNVRSFRETEPQSVAKICKNLENKEHNFKLTVKSGELHLNFITNHMYYFQNAGIGGYAASTFLGGAYAWFPNTTTDEIVAFDPDLFIFESATNDANTWQREENGGRSTNNWKLESSISFTIVRNKPNQIELSQSPTKSIEVGDVVIMGEYSGNINTLAVGIVSNVNSNIITLKDNVPTNVQKYCKIKSIKEWEDNVKEVVSRVKTGIGHSLSVGIATCGVPNYDRNNYPDYARRLMGYREKGIMLANDNNWMFFDFFKKLVNNGYVGIEANKGPNERWSKGDNTHPDVLGYGLFGEAITDVLKAQ